MAVITPQYDISTMSGGYLKMIFDSLPRPFNPDPKPKNALTLAPTGTPQYPYVSIKDSTLYIHSQPLLTPAYTPEVALDLTQYSLFSLASAINSGGYGYAASYVVQDGAKASLLLGFINQALNGTDTVQIQIATSRLWKYMYPIAQALNVAAIASGDAENAMYQPFASGFWLDFWGDWFSVPRLPGMNDVQYVAYLLWNLRVPKVNNMAMEDFLSAKYQVPVKISDTGNAQFTAYIDAKALVAQTSTTDISNTISKIKAAGVNFLVTYFSAMSENYKSFLYNRYGWTDLSNMAVMRVQVQQTYSETRYGFAGTSFMLGGTQGNSQLNITPFGGGLLLKDAYTMH